MEGRGKRSKLYSPYHYDALFGLRTHICTMTWQRGALIRDIDRDSLLIGDREVMINRVLRNNTEELQPDKKLQSPAVGMQVLDILI